MTVRQLGPLRLDISRLPDGGTAFDRDVLMCAARILKDAAGGNENPDQANRFGKLGNLIRGAVREYWEVPR